MKLLGLIIVALILTGCASTRSISFSPSQDYAVTVESALFDSVRTEPNDTTLFNEGKAIGFIRTEPVPTDVASTEAFLETLRKASESETVKTRPLHFSGKFTGFAVINRDYFTGYLATKEDANTILVISFPEDEFDEIAESISSGI